MASGSIGLTSNVSQAGGRIDWQSYTNNQGNYSDVSAQVYVVLNGWGIQGTGAGQWKENGNTVNTFSPYINIAWGGYGTVQVFTKNGIRVNHNDNGDAGITLGCDMQFSFAGVSNIGGSGWCTMDHIPRYATSTISERGKTINSISINWSSDVPTDHRRYSLNGGGWTDTGDSSSMTTSGYFTISNLEPNTSYKVKIQVKRRDSQLWSESNTITIITYNYATITEAPNITIGEDATIKYNNPAGASTQVYIKAATGETLTTTQSATGGTHTFEFTNEENNYIYSLIPNNTKIDVVYYIVTSQNGKSYTQSLSGKSFSINTSECTPTLDLSNPVSLMIEDVNSVTAVLTGNSDTLIKGYSNAEITLNEDAVPKKSATIVKYIFSDGTSNVEITADESNSPDDSVVINKIMRNYIDVTAVDSRGLSVTASYEMINNYFNEYTKPVIYSSDTSLKRVNGVTSSLEFKFLGQYYPTALGEIIGVVFDEITYEGEWNEPVLKYKKILASSNNWDAAEWITIPTSKYTGVVAEGGTGDGVLKNVENAILTDFTVGNAYQIKLRLEDFLDYAEVILTVSSGEPIMAWNKSKKIVGVGKIPDKTLPTGSMDILGDVHAENVNVNSVDSDEIKIQGVEIVSTILNKVYPIGSIYMSVNNVNPSEFLGGTWQQIAQGRTLVGVDDNDEDFNTVKKTGGSKYLQSHTHTMNSAGSHNHNVKFDQVWDLTGGTVSLGTVDGGPYDGAGFVKDAGSHTHTINTAGTGDSGNLQPYFTCYIWERTA